MDYLLIIIGIFLVLFIYALVSLNNNYNTIIKSNKKIAKELNKYKSLLEQSEKELQNQIQKCLENNPIPNKPILKTTVCEKPVIPIVPKFGSCLSTCIVTVPPVAVFPVTPTTK